MNTLEEYEDYSRDFEPDLNYQGFSKNTLVRLLKLYGELYQAVDGFWYLAVKQRINNEEALACDKWVWEKGIKYELQRLTRLMNIQGNDVAALMKSFQMSPWFWNFVYEIDLRSRNHAIFTITRCSTLEALEKEGGDRIKTICGMIEPMIYRHYANFFNANMQMQILKLPPRQDKSEICCRWEFRLKSSQ